MFSKSKHQLLKATLCWGNFIQKISHFMLQFPVNLKKPDFGSTWDLFAPKIPKHQVCWNVSPNFQLLCCCNIMQKITKFHALTFDNTWKTWFWRHFGLLLAQKLKNKVVLENFFCIVFTLLNLKQKNFHVLTFDNTWKTSSNFLKTNFFPKSRAGQF